MKCITTHGPRFIYDWQLIKPYANFKDWKCYPENQIVIDFYDKTIRNTVCLANKNQSFDEYKPVKVLTCPRNNCFCPTDIQLKKAAADIYYEMLEDYHSNQPYRQDKLLAIEGKKSFHIEAYLEKKCNFTCSYCKDYKRNFKGKPLQLDYLQKTFRRFVPDNDIHKTMQISGGEPTLQPHYLQWLEWLHNNYNIEIRTLTNGTRQVKYLLDLNRLSLITISLHFEFINDNYINKCLRFLLERTSEHQHVIFKAMYLPGNKDIIAYTMSKFIDHITENRLSNIGLKIGLLWDQTHKQSLYNYSKADLDFVSYYTRDF